MSVGAVFVTPVSDNTIRPSVSGSGDIDGYRLNGIVLIINAGRPSAQRQTDLRQADLEPYKLPATALEPFTARSNQKRLQSSSDIDSPALLIHDVRNLDI